ncbi:MAG TPA: hypothetical protein VFU02_15545, partial [Polyangiaceae bacterium]|nr:hypothetical protein [Polyangiaceae bacterium]
MAEYNLYIDESGKFRGHRRLSVVSGVLENASAGIDWNRARELLAEALPLVPYPFHANLIHEPALWVAVAMLARSGAPASMTSLIGEVRELADPAVRSLTGLARKDRAPIEGFLAALGAGRLPDKARLMTCSAFLQRHALESYRMLEALRDRMRVRLETRYRQLLQGQGDDLMAVAAVADAREPDAPDDYTGAA